MNKWAPVIPAMLLAGTLLAQWPALPQDSVIDDRTGIRHVAWFRGGAEANMNSLENGLFAGLWRGALLDRGMRERIRDGLKERNRAGYLLGAEMAYIGPDSLFRRGGWHPMVHLGYRDMLGVRFAPDLYTTAFLGNAGFEGRTAELGPTAHAAIRFATIGLGVSDAHGQRFLRLAMVRGDAMTASDLRRADLYTAPDGRALVLDLQGELWQSGTSSREIEAGWGLALSGAWKGDHLLAGRTMQWSFSVEDLGFMCWRPGTFHLGRDTVIDYTGIHIASISSLDQTLISGDQLLDTLGLRSSRTTKLDLLPFRAAFEWVMRTGGPWFYALELRYVHLPGYMPETTLSGGRTIGPKAQVSACLGYGGFGGPRFGLGGRWRVDRHVSFGMSTTHLPGFLLGRMRGWGAQGSLIYHLP